MIACMFGIWESEQIRICQLYCIWVTHVHLLGCRRMFLSIFFFRMCFSICSANVHQGTQKRSELRCILSFLLIQRNTPPFAASRSMCWHMCDCKPSLFYWVGFLKLHALSRWFKRSASCSRLWLWCSISYKTFMLCVQTLCFTY